MGIYNGCTVFSILWYCLFYLFWARFFFSVCLAVWQCDWTVLCVVLKRVHKWLRYCSHVSWLMQQFLHHLLWPCFYPLLPLQKLSEIVLEKACPEALHRSGCFDSHISIYQYIYIYIYIYMVVCVLFTYLHGGPFTSTLRRQRIKWRFYQVVMAFAP